MERSRDGTPAGPRIEAEAGGRSVRLAGTWTLARLLPQRRALEAELRQRAQGQPEWDATGIESLDATGAALLWNAWGRRRPGQLRLRPEQEALLARIGAPAAVPAPAPPLWSPRVPLVALGDAVLSLGSHARALVALVGQLLLDVAGLLARPGRAPLRELSANVYRAGATALPITAMVGFLIGIVVSYLSAQQLRTFGANVLIVNLLGLSILRELGPLLAAILVAGRSGSAMTAQIGVMHVTQELDALAALGIRATLRLVLPRVLALALALPLLVVWTDAIALLGGILASDLELGIGLSHFLSRLPDVVPVVEPVDRRRQGRGVRRADRVGRLPLRAAHRTEHREPRRGHHGFGRHRDHVGAGGGRGVRGRAVRRRHGRPAVSEADCVVSLEDLWTGLGGRTIHEGVTLCVRRGEVLSLIGGSGSGKTVLLRHMLGLQQPLRGRVRVLGQDLRSGDPGALDAVRRRWGVLFQGGALFSALSVHENVALPLRELHAFDEAVIADVVRLKLGLVGLQAGDADKRPAQLSGGMVKRAALARALALDPELLFLDEPTSGLDPPSAASFQELVRAAASPIAAHGGDDHARPRDAGGAERPRGRARRGPHRGARYVRRGARRAAPVRARILRPSAGVSRRGLRRR